MKSFTLLLLGSFIGWVLCELKAEYYAEKLKDDVTRKWRE